MFANNAFVRLTGYAREDIMGRNFRFLQGAETNPQSVAALRAAMSERKRIVIDIRNYKKDGTPFWNRLTIRPVLDIDGNLKSFVGAQHQVPAEDVIETAQVTPLKRRS